MHAAIQSLELVFGRGDDDYPLWLLTIRVNILVVLIASLLVILWHAAPKRLRAVAPATWWTVAFLTVLAAFWRIVVASPNLFDFGGIPYSRLLYGYKGYFATAQFYAPLYQLTARDMEHGLLFQRIAGTLTIPLVYALCHRLSGAVFASIAAFLFAVYPLHILFSPSDALAVFTTFLAAVSYLLLAKAAGVSDRRVAGLHFLAGFAGLVLLTQVRPENVLLLLPPALLLWSRPAAAPRVLMVPLVIAAAFAAVYASATVTAGVAHQNPVDIGRGMTLTLEHLLLNPFTAAPLLLVATAAIAVRRGVGLTVLALLPWVAVFLLCVFTIEDGHGAARIYANWLILILPAAAYGLAQLSSWDRRLARVVVGLSLLCFGAMPLLARDRLATRYLEILEHERFGALLAALPDGVDRVVVPDDERMWRQYHSTLEVYRKYLAILWSRPQAAQRVRLIGITEYLAAPEAAGCAGGGCIFFSGIPCIDEDRYAVTKDQCDELLRDHRATLIEESEVIAAPFVACSIYVGELRRRLCDPATLPRTFRVYRVGE